MHFPAISRVIGIVHTPVSGLEPQRLFFLRRHTALLGQGNKMRYIDFLRADEGAGARGVAAVHPLVAVKALEPLPLFPFTRVHDPHDGCEHGIGPQEIPVAADAGRRAAEAVDAAACR